MTNCHVLYVKFELCLFSKPTFNFPCTASTQNLHKKLISAPEYSQASNSDVREVQETSTQFTCTICHMHSISTSDFEKHNQQMHPGIGYNFMVYGQYFPSKQKGSWIVNLESHSPKTHPISKEEKIHQEKIDNKFSADPINKIETQCDDTNKHEDEYEPSNFGDDLLDEEMENQVQSE